MRSNGTVGVGVIKSLYAEILFLHLVEADTKLLILTDGDLCRHFVALSHGKAPAEIEIIHCPLPPDIAQRIAVVHEAASLEIMKRALS